jgi:hypothetical protein
MFSPKRETRFVVCRRLVDISSGERDLAEVDEYAGGLLRGGQPRAIVLDLLLKHPWLKVVSLVPKGWRLEPRHPRAFICLAHASGMSPPARTTLPKGEDRGSLYLSTGIVEASVTGLSCPRKLLR